ncbi:LLM class flavin-dependent oxidoreductase [Nocardia sp. NBC_00565]|uniref:LLM class flavin-dependent oxidoreductase n=1 Tax=Nocardia sp. NBC_00565 TaxID=2975993 RepID=UPI002E7FE8C0|nr:LLM class flavin-dependent oxidoreductase [Nocardia sp. NBC_00565]WUC06716.1 LLM class flavin-dependent oxidoreductase [Nocardia sp. NBC_00565]
MTVDPGDSVPATAASKVEFISLTHLNPATELNPIPSRGIDLAFLRRYVRALEDGGFDLTLLPYASASADSFVLASAVGQLSERLKPIVALRPNTVFPTVAAQQLATLDQLTEGRAVVHLISGGNAAEQARQGDYLSKEQRYARTDEYIDILRDAWTKTEPFSHDGAHYRFDGFGPGFAPYAGSIPISIGGSSDASFGIGGRKADIFSFWGEPLADIKSQIERVHAIAAAAGRTDRPRIWVTFRPIIDRTDELAWAKAHDYVARIEHTFRTGALRKQYAGAKPENVGSQRLLEFASRQDVYDRALWTRTAAATNAAGASTALVGSPETVAAAIVDYIDLGADLVSIRGYDTLNDVIDYGRYVLPLVRQELAHREATGRRGTLQAEHPGALAAAGRS